MKDLEKQMKDMEEKYEKFIKKLMVRISNLENKSEDKNDSEYKCKNGANNKLVPTK